VKESRDVSNGRRGVPVSKPVPANNDLSLEDPTGVKTPELAVTAADEALAVATPAGQNNASDVK
jgi:hypothetical protein